MTYANKHIIPIAGLVEENKSLVSKNDKPYNIIRLSWNEGAGEKTKQKRAEVVAFGGLGEEVPEDALVILMCRVDFDSYESKGEERLSVKLFLEDWAVRPEPTKAEEGEIPF